VTWAGDEHGDYAWVPEADTWFRDMDLTESVNFNAAVPGRAIAGRLHISEHTLRNHLTVIYSKLGVPNRLALYAYACKHGLNGLSGASLSGGVPSPHACATRP